MADECHGALDLPTESLDFTHGFSWTLQPENVMYYNDGRSEVDFYVPSADLAIQVCRELRKTASTFERETEALRRFAGFKLEARRLILTLSESERLTVRGVEIEVMPAWRWMLQA